MAKLDFNAIKRPTLELTMKDKKHTIIRVTTPKESSIERLDAMGKELREIVDNGDRAETKAVFELAAELINFNLDDLTVTADELKSVYKLNLNIQRPPGGFTWWLNMQGCHCCKCVSWTTSSS